ncbi:unnamed protein product [Scytosiphon promiscuus]
MRPSSRHLLALLLLGKVPAFGGFSFALVPSSPTPPLGETGCQQQRRKRWWLGERSPPTNTSSTRESWRRRRRSPPRCKQAAGASSGRRRRASIRAGSALRASLPTAGAAGLGLLPSLDGLPGGATTAESPRQSSTGGGGRSRRGKYPVVELYRREAGGRDAAASVLDSARGHDDNDVDDDLAGGRLSRGAARPRAPTAVEHLRSVLGLGSEQVDLMLESFPALAEVPPEKLNLEAKLLFLNHTIGGEASAVAVSFPQFFGHPLERHIAPRHAFLVASGRPSGARLLERGCRGLRRMLELPVNRFVVEMTPGREMSDYRRFEQAFLRGPFDAARKGNGEILRLLRSHGWDCWETDRRGRTALFWAAGGGSVEACEALVEGDGGLRPQDQGGDGSTPLFWAVAGVETRRFGTGGHVNVCRWLLDRGADPGTTTHEGNTLAMWAAWAGGLEATRWAVEEAGAADSLGACNANGCTVAHWASSGGDEAVCRYLRSKGVDFTQTNKGGNDPLNHAVAYGRRDIARWLLEEVHGDPPPSHGNKKDKHDVDGSSATTSVGMPEVEEGVGAAAETPTATTAAAAAETAAVDAAMVGVGRRRRDDPHLLELARLTGDANMEAFLQGVDSSH